MRNMDLSLIDDLTRRIYSSKMDRWEEEVVLWLVILRTIPMDAPEVETNGLVSKSDFEDLVNGVIYIKSHYGDFYPSYELHLFMRELHFGVVGKNPSSDVSTRLMMEERLFDDNYPQAGDLLGVYDHLVGNMEESVLMEEDNQQSCDLFTTVFNYFLRKIRNQLEEFRPWLKKVLDQRSERLDNDDLKRVLTWIRSLVYEVEFVLDSFLSKNCPRFESARWLAKVLHRLPGKIVKKMVDDIIKELPYSRNPSMEVGSKESIINHVVSTDRDQIIPIINYDDDGIGETLRQIFIDEKIVTTFDICKWSLAELPNSPHLMKLYEDQFWKRSYDKTEFDIKVVKEYATTLRPEEFKELLEELLNARKNYLVIFENVTSELQFNLLRDLINRSSVSKPCKILYTTDEADVAQKCRLNSPTIFYIPSKRNYNTPDVTIEREVVGFNKEKEEMLDRLIKGDVSRCVISISGMPGLGKTTLAKLLYKHPSVTRHFHVQAFCTVSQVYKLRELLLQLVFHFFPSDDTLHGLENIELAAKICKSLKHRRYLVVLDDIWDIDAWKAITNCFPDDKNGSRIIITTRQTNLMPFNIQSVNLLSDVECWELLEKEVFQDQNCPEELTTIGETIARNCKGLPLSIILIAGFLKKMDKTTAAWEKIAETLASALDVDVEAKRKGIIELSYKHLPDCLQPCFLYFGIFSEDHKIPAEKLIRLWSAEGLLLQKVGDDTKSVEEVAESYLIDLAGRSLVTIAEENLRSRVKSYQVHDLIREFCIAKAQEEKLFLRLSGYEELSAYSNFLIENNHEFDKSPIPSGPRRLAINCERKHFVETKLSALPLVRSMLFIASKSNTPLNTIYDVSFIYEYFKLLKILDLEDIIVGDSSLPLIFELVLLKYLAIQSDANHIPGKLSNLRNLETLIFKSSKDNKVIQVPDSFWDMTKLRHVQISGNPDFDLDPKRVENTSTVVPKDLQTFSSPSLSVGGKLEKVLPRLQSIRKLKCRFSVSDQSLDVSENGQLFPVLDFLSNLESLNVVYSMQQNFEFTSSEFKFKFPEYLTKLTLSNFCMPWKEMSQLTKLKELKVLKIRNKAFTGKTWDMSEQDEAFEKLEVLKLDALDIVNWCGVYEEHFPKLKHLLLFNLEKLEKIPDGVGDINSLEMIDVKWCNAFVEKSAKGIKEEWGEYGNEISIVIHSKAREIEGAFDEELDGFTELAIE